MKFDIVSMKALWRQAFGDPDVFIEGFFRTGFSPERCRCLYEEGALAAALYWFDFSCRGKKLAYLYAVATDEAFRGRGLCRRLTEQTHEQLKRLGYAGAILVPARPELFSMYEKLGYRPCCPMDRHEVSAAGNVQAVSISPIAYAMAREKYLPPDSAIVRNGHDFLQTYNGFYKSDGCIFCAALEKDTVYFQEFLGDTAKLPGAVAALGGKTGIVRLPGTQPFAMYCAFTDDPPPAYFNLPMD